MWRPADEACEESKMAQKKKKNGSTNPFFFALKLGEVIKDDFLSIS